MLELLNNCLINGKKAAMVTLHDPTLALTYCDRLLLLSEGKIIGTICPKTDSIDQMETLLCYLYGKISLARLTSRSGREHLVMLKEDEEQEMIQ